MCKQYISDCLKIVKLPLPPGPGRCGLRRLSSDLTFHSVGLGPEDDFHSIKRDLRSDDGFFASCVVFSPDGDHLGLTTPFRKSEKREVRLLSPTAYLQFPASVSTT